MKVLVVGASRGTGAALVSELAERGHLVTAYARQPGGGDERVHHVAGDVLDREALAKAMIGQDAVAVTLGIPDNPFRVRLTRRASSPLDVRSRGTAGVVAAMREHGVPRIAILSVYGIGESYAELPLALKAFFSLAIRPQVDDHERQERLVRASGLEWTIVQPTVLHDEPTEAAPYVGSGERPPSMRVSRRQVARVLADALEQDALVGRVLTVSEAAG
ncbi:NAD(P)H-binding protein [Nocardioides sp. MAH-18]|uniref:NAD(P)H-binding protein n=1 Tax=Nocardioides agri TaxID=2682843 RepID=A0A6L6XW83_9ACTN|nr:MULTISPECIES: NAD(P)-binding oxidoreductase [unclassified Nocardioides]MBA2952492.1 SDR family oxidoreductase [Nocardioides sp. CGMCC 1.13656]MVQ51654.1 NAD(P)H-binding protein [Nocardioides sp. MAH-18]